MGPAHREGNQPIEARPGLGILLEKNR